MIVDHTDEIVERKLPAFFLEIGGPSLLREQANGMRLNVHNLAKYYTSVILPASRKNLLFAAVEDGQVVGFTYADATINDHYQFDKPVISGAFTFVLPNYRQKGIATELRTKLLESIKAQGYKIVFAQINETNDASNASMQKFFEELPHTKATIYRAEL